MNQIFEQLGSGALPQIHLWGFLLAMGISVLAALAAEWMYLHFYENRATGAQIHRAFPLLGPSITLLFVCVQLSLPLSLGLLGALSIIRFRTPIKEPEEVSFIMLIIAAAVACATFNFVFLGILYLVVFLVLTVRSWSSRRKKLITAREGVLMVSLPDAAYAGLGTVLDDYLQEAFKVVRLESVSNAEGMTTLNFAFSGMLPASWQDVQTAVNERVPESKLTAFFSRPGGLV